MDTEDIATIERARKIARLNDAARSNAANYMATRGIMSLDEVTISDIFVTVQNFNKFTEDNDPYGEHDFGQIKLDGKTLFWKIDYYDQGLEGWCDPLSPDCNRVLTVMLAEEY